MPALCFGTATFGGGSELFEAWGSSGVAEATLQRPSVASVSIGARNAAQLKANLGAVGWSLTTEQVKRLDEASNVTPVYPYWHQRSDFAARNPPPV